MNKKYKRYLDEIEKTETKITELQEYLKVTKAALKQEEELEMIKACLLYTSPSPRDTR